MDRYNRDRYDYGDNRAQNWEKYGNSQQNWPGHEGSHNEQQDWHGREMSRDYDHLHQYSQNDQDQHRNNNGYNSNRNEYRGDNRNSGDHYQFGPERGKQDNRDRFGQQHQYRQDQNGHQPYSNNFSRDHDRFGDQYQDNFRQDPTLPRRREDDGLMGNIRQGYGISSFDGISDRFNTLDSEHRYGGGQNERRYYSGDRDGYQSSQFGGGLGNSGIHSHRGVPDYGIHNFSDNEGSGLGSSYGGQNYGGGQGYTSGHRGGTLGNSSYGSYSGNFSGYGPGGSTYGGGRSSTGDTAHNSDRGTNELGGF